MPGRGGIGGEAHEGLRRRQRERSCKTDIWPDERNSWCHASLASRGLRVIGKLSSREGIGGGLSARLFGGRLEDWLKGEILTPLRRPIPARLFCFTTKPLSKGRRHTHCTCSACSSFVCRNSTLSPGTPSISPAPETSLPFLIAQVAMRQSLRS